MSAMIMAQRSDCADQRRLRVGARTISGQLVYAPTYEYARRVLKHYAVISGDAEATNHFRKFGLASDEYLVEKRAR